MLAGNTFFSTLDMNSGYWHVPLDERDKHITAFMTKYGLNEYNRMPFGLTNGPSVFQRMVQLVLSGLTWKILEYLNDIIVLEKDFKSHLANIVKVLWSFREYTQT